MKKIFGLTVGIATAIVLMLSLQITAKAQVYGDFDTVRQIRNVPYEPLEDGIEIPAGAFGLPPTWSQDLDDGYSFPNGILIGFPFEFGGEVYTSLWVCINGFVTFSQPPLTPAKDPTALFYENTSYPKNVLAPFWGDHHYHKVEERNNGYKPTKILFKSDPDRGVFIVEWRYLNINDVNVPSSIATFQLRLYKSQDPYSAQGDIEFAYGQVGGNEYTNDTRVITRGASVGIKGEFSPADFLNGLEFEKDPYIARTSMKLTNEWAPSGGTDHRIRFRSMARFNVEEFWGDGDVDLSKGYNRKHYNMPQSRYVTVNDARIIMKSMATGIPLDSVRRRAAYHGDVNHNGRYYYNQSGQKVEIKWRNKNYADSLPADVGSIKQIFYQVNEYDAALILHYIAARLPELPWLYDTIPLYGKISATELANNVYFGISEEYNGKIRMPVYLNGELKGPLSLFVQMDEPFKIEANNPDLLVENGDNRAVLVGSGVFSPDAPIAYLVFENNPVVIKKLNVRFNEQEVNPRFLMKVNPSEESNGLSILENGTSNPQIWLNLENAGTYKVSVVDLAGNIVKAFDFTVTTPSRFAVDWNLSDVNGNALNTGVYFVRLSGNGTNIIEKLVLVR